MCAIFGFFQVFQILLILLEGVLCKPVNFNGIICGVNPEKLLS